MPSRSSSAWRGDRHRREPGYLVPTLTTFLAFVMLLYDDPGEGEGRFWERVLETGLGIAAAAVFGLMLPALLDRSTSARTRRPSPEPSPATRWASMSM